jgi:hypothetical protein
MCFFGMLVALAFGAVAGVVVLKYWWRPAIVQAWLGLPPFPPKTPPAP